MNRPQARFLLRLNEITHQRLTRLAQQRGSSINQLCNELIENGLSQGGTQDSQLLQSIQQTYADDGLMGVILFGSQARGDATSQSDIDLLFIFEPNTPINRKLYQKWKNDAYSVHCVSFPKDEARDSSFWFEIALDGKILWGAEKLRPFLNEMKRKLSSGKYIRKLTHGQPYWIQTK
jgi:predicted nucleotidyltransferase